MAKNEDKKKLERKDIAIIAIIICLAIFIVSGGDIESVQEFFEEVEEIIPNDADVELYKFNDLSNETKLSVELWLINNGESTAENIVIFVRVRDNEGNCLLEDEISMTKTILDNNETTSGMYIAPINNQKEIYHTIEITWNSGQNAYLETTSL